MKRKDFLRNSALATLGLTTLATASCDPHDAFRKKKTGEGDVAKFELDEMTIDQLQEKMKNGDYTSEKITNLYLDRIKDIDKDGPTLNSVIEINPDAVKIAKAMDEERKAGKVRGPLHGIPILLKDNIDTGDQMMTTAGALAMEGHKASKDAHVAKQLRAAGAVILGKTNLSEWANFRSTRSSSGWSSRGGQTRNPYVLDRSPCGSSSGSAVAVAASLCAVAVGTETDGSIACPASMNGVAGIKPTVGLVSRSGIIPISKTQDTAGPFGRTLKDAVYLLAGMTGIDADDPATAGSEGKSKTDYSVFLDPAGLKGKRIGIEKTMLKKHEAVDILLFNAIEQMKSAGATIVELEFIKKQNDISGDEFKVLEYEFKDGLNRYLATANASMKSLEDVINFNKKNEARAMPYFKQEILDSCQAKGGLDSKEYLDALKKCNNLRKVIDDLLTASKLDALCGPATGTSWCIDLVNGDFWTGYGAYGPAAVAGYPSVTVPMGNVNELPVGLSFLGRAYDEPGLIAIAYAYEQLSKSRKAPGFKKSVS